MATYEISFYITAEVHQLTIADNVQDALTQGLDFIKNYIDSDKIKINKIIVRRDES